MIIFFILFFGIYSLVNYYIYLRGAQALPPKSLIKTIYTFVFLFLASAYILSRFLEKFDAGFLHAFFYRSGSLWFAAMEYFLITVILIDLIRLVNIPGGFLPEPAGMAYLKLRQYTMLTSVLLVSGLIVYGYINAKRPVVNKLMVNIVKPSVEPGELNIVMVSDIHLGVLFGKERVGDMVDRINHLNPDLVILAGDILDEVQEPIFRRDIGQPLADIRAKYGTWAVTGNHEYIGNAEKAVDYIQSKGINVLRDQFVVIHEQIILAGREDRDSRNFNGYKRKTLHEILKGAAPGMPVILVDHQPLQLQQAVDAGVDLQLSGHTHHGQFWPNNYFTRWIFEISKGYKQTGNTHFYVSHGYGFWGPPVRIGPRPEIVNIRLVLQPAD